MRTVEKTQRFTAEHMAEKQGGSILFEEKNFFLDTSSACQAHTNVLM